MLKSTGVEKTNIAVFISGKGTNFKSLIQYSLKKQSKFKIKLVVSDSLIAKGLEYAKKFKIKKKIINYKNLTNSETLILNDLNKENINIICLAGFMRILTANFIKKFKGKIINIHPSLLPKYKGLNTHQRALDNKDKYSGCTVHFVNSKLDAGKIILQKKVKIYKNDTSEKLSKRILKQEHLLYPKALEKIISSL
ncbi:phosphoribosylglycinamide formyltransferase [Candidatus Pelagibacter sp.]|jgi:phosphoribosylglycinamide formyltransferase-1|nr:phosphoribosylglycinamide formyltransferase [Candidatus Pelagibacter sp.]